MKLSSAYSCLLATTLTTLGVATILVDPVPSTVHVNDALEITWSTDHDYNLQLLFVRKGQGNIFWTSVETIFNNREEARGNSSYNLTVPCVAPSGSYALWLSGENIPSDGGGYANLTNWFKVEGGTEDALSTGHIAGVIVGIAMAVSLIAVAIFVLRKRNLRKAPRVSLVEARPREYFDSIMDEKAEHKLTMTNVDV